MALVFSNPSEPDAVMEPSVTQLRCSSCKLIKPCCACERGQCSHKEPSAFPPSCVRWRRGMCNPCRTSKARSVPLMARKLDSARRKYGSNKAVTLTDAERLLSSCCIAAGLTVPASDSELAPWHLVKEDDGKPFTPENATWVKRRGGAQVPRSC